MNINEDFKEIIKFTHCYNWLPDWEIVKNIYNEFPDSYSILTPFAYSYLEEIIRSTTSEYGNMNINNEGKKFKRKVGIDLINKAINENRYNIEYVAILKEMKNYFENAQPTDRGNNRHSVDRGFLPPIFWEKQSFEKLIHDIARISKFNGF